MIGKVMTGKSFGSCVSYVVGKPEAVILDAQGVRIDSAERIIRDFDLQRKMNPELSQAAGHIALSWSSLDRDKLNENVMVRVAKAYLEKMNIRDTQYLITLHQDRQHPHVHIIYNRVNNQGKTISDRFQRQLNAGVCKELTLEHGYHLAEGKSQVNRNRLRGSDKEKYQLFDAISKAVGQSSSWKGLEEKLGRRGISVQYKYRSGTTEVQGVSFGRGVTSSKAMTGSEGDRRGENGRGSERDLATVSFKGSELDRSLSYGNISKELAQNRKALGLEEPDPRQASPAGSDRNREDYASSSPAPAFSQASNLAAGEDHASKAADQETGNSVTAAQRTGTQVTAAHENDSGETEVQESESVHTPVVKTAGQLVTSLLSGLSFSSGEQDTDDEQHKKKKKQGYKR